MSNRSYRDVTFISRGRKRTARVHYVIDGDGCMVPTSVRTLGLFRGQALFGADRDAVLFSTGFMDEATYETIMQDHGLTRPSPEYGRRRLRTA